MANLRDSAMLVRQRTRQWTGASTDRRVLDAAVKNHGVSQAALRGGQKLLVGDTQGQPLLNAVGAVFSEANHDHLSRTLPWLDSGERILSAAAFNDYMAATRGFKDRIDAAVAVFVDWYEAEYVLGMPNCRRALNGLFEVMDYPIPSVMPGRFLLDPSILNFPSAEDFRVDLGAGELARVRANIEASVDTALDAAMADVWARIRSSVGHMAERLAAYDNSGDKVVGKFHDTLVANVRELVGLLPGLNVTGDPNVSEITRLMGELLVPLPAAGSEPGKDDAAAALRENERLRRDTAAAADAILAQMADFV